MSDNAYDPELMAAIRDEEQYVADQQHGQRQVKLEKGQIWRVRFIPAKLGPSKRFYARIAKHWLNKKPITCPIHTGEDYGGSKEAYCSPCEVANRLNQEAEDEVRNFGYKSRGTPQWLTYCIVIDKDGTEVSGNEILMPYEFWHYTNTWEELKAFWKAGSRGGKNLASVLDYKTGNDFCVSRTAKGYRLDKQDSTPIFDPEDTNFLKYIAKIESQIKSPRVKIPKDEELDVFAGKIEEEGDRLMGRGVRRPTRRVSPVSDAELDEPPAEEQPRRRPAPSLPASTQRRATPQAAAVDDEEGMQPVAEDDSNPELMPQPKPKRPVQQPEPEAEEDAPPPQQARAQTTVPKKRPAPEPELEDEPVAAAEEEPESVEDVPPPRRAATPARPASGPKRASNLNDKVSDDAEELPEEAVDTAPPVKKPVRQAIEEPADEAPTPVARKAGLGSSIRDKVKQAAARDE